MRNVFSIVFFSPCKILLLYHKIKLVLQILQTDGASGKTLFYWQKNLIAISNALYLLKLEKSNLEELDIVKL